MADPTLEERMTAMEAELAQLKQVLITNKPPQSTPWWERRLGAFAGSEAYLEAEHLGRQYRDSQQYVDEVL
jgi:hypothetical protein